MCFKSHFFQCKRTPKSLNSAELYVVAVTILVYSRLLSFNFKPLYLPKTHFSPIRLLYYDSLLKYCHIHLSYIIPALFYTNRAYFMHLYQVVIRADLLNYSLTLLARLELATSLLYY